MVEQETPKAADAGEVWTDEPDVQTGEGTRRPRDAAEQADVVPGFTGTGPSGSQGGRAEHGAVPRETPLDAFGEEKTSPPVPRVKAGETPRSPHTTEAAEPET